MQVNGYDYFYKDIIVENARLRVRLPHAVPSPKVVFVNTCFALWCNRTPVDAVPSLPRSVLRDTPRKGGYGEPFPDFILRDFFFFFVRSGGTQDPLRFLQSFISFGSFSSVHALSPNLVGAIDLSRLHLCHRAVPNRPLGLRQNGYTHTKVTTLFVFSLKIFIDFDLDSFPHLHVRHRRVFLVALAAGHRLSQLAALSRTPALFLRV